MRAILAASLLLSPLFVPAAAFASKPAISAAATTQAAEVSTGVNEPTILRRAPVVLSPDLYASFPDDAAVVLKLNVDQDGVAQDIHVVRSVDPKIDLPVVNAVRQFDWRPANLDHRTIADNVVLKVLVNR